MDGWIDGAVDTTISYFYTTGYPNSSYYSVEMYMYIHKKIKNKKKIKREREREKEKNNDKNIIIHSFVHSIFVLLIILQVNTFHFLFVCFPFLSSFSLLHFSCSPSPVLPNPHHSAILLI